MQRPCRRRLVWQCRIAWNKLGAHLTRPAWYGPLGLLWGLQDEANELETELLMELHGQLLVKAGMIYSQLAQDGWADDDSAEGDKAAWQQQGVAADSEDTEDEGADSGDEGEAAHQAAVRRAKQKQQGWRVSKAGVLIGMIVLMLLAEVFVFLDMAGLFRGSKQ